MQARFENEEAAKLAAGAAAHLLPLEIETELLSTSEGAHLDPRAADAFGAALDEILECVAGAEPECAEARSLVRAQQVKPTVRPTVR